jgi:hypothetical protein
LLIFRLRNEHLQFRMYLLKSILFSDLLGEEFSRGIIRDDCPTIRDILKRRTHVYRLQSQEYSLKRAKIRGTLIHSSLSEFHTTISTFQLPDSFTSSRDNRLNSAATRQSCFGRKTKTSRQLCAF